MNIRGLIDTITGAVGTITDFGLKLVVALVVVDVIYPGTTGVVSNLGAIAGQFGEHGMAGLIALFLFAMLYKK
mgnify:CR=1 FL=1|jgi:hypothetical protein